MTVRRLVDVTAATAAALLLSACTLIPAITSTHGRGAGPEHHPHPLPATTTQVPPATGDGPGLLNRIIQPDGATPLVVPGAPTGILTMARLIARSHPGIPAADLPFYKAELDYLHFTLAAEKDWRMTDGSEIDIQLIQFNRLVGGRDFLQVTDMFMLRDKTRFSDTALTRFDPATGALLNGTLYESGPDTHGIRTALFSAHDDGNIAILIYVRAKAFNRATEKTVFALQAQAVGHD